MTAICEVQVLNHRWFVGSSRHVSLVKSRFDGSVNDAMRASISAGNSRSGMMLSVNSTSTVHQIAFQGDAHSDFCL